MSNKTLNKNKISKKEAIRQLWEMGDLSYKLKGIQLIMRQAVYEASKQVSNFLVARQSGKSYTMCCIGTEYCVKNPNVTVVLLFPKKKDAAGVARDHMRKILEDCPPHLKPEYMVADKMFVFPNGSKILMAGTDGGSAESIRGKTVHLILMDEAGFHDYNDFQYIVTSILFPTMTTTDGRIIMASTPSKQIDHPYMTNYVEPMRASGELVEFDVYSNPLIGKEKIEQIADNYPLGFEDPDFQREYLLQTEVSGDLMVIPEWFKVKDDVVKASEMPVYYDYYVSCDPSVVDGTGIIFAYYDYVRKVLVVYDEAFLGGEGTDSLTTEEIADCIIRKERMHFTNKFTGEQQKPALRIMDDNMPLLVNDLQEKHDISFVKTKKTDKQDKINKVRMMMRRGELEIHPRCKITREHIRTAKWDKQRKKFVRNKGSKQNGVVSNHSDLVDALVYLCRNFIPSKNPFPPGYFDMQGPGVFESRKPKKPSHFERLGNAILGKKK